MMIDFGADLRPTQTTRTVVEEMPVVVESVRITPSQSRSFLTKPQEHWGWAELRDYVIEQIEARHGPQVRDAKKEAAIFKSFLSRYGEQAVAIARMAFEIHDGMWRNAPISVNRFCKASDVYFADVLRQRT